MVRQRSTIRKNYQRSPEQEKGEEAEHGGKQGSQENCKRTHIETGYTQTIQRDSNNKYEIS